MLFSRVNGEEVVGVFPWGRLRVIRFCRYVRNCFIKCFKFVFGNSI